MNLSSQISKMVGSGWLLEIFENGRLVSETQHPSFWYARDAAKAAGAKVAVF